MRCKSRVALVRIDLYGVLHVAYVGYIPQRTFHVLDAKDNGLVKTVALT